MITSIVCALLATGTAQVQDEPSTSEWPNAYITSLQRPAGSDKAQGQGAWYLETGDPALDALIEQTLKNNESIRAQRARADVAHAQVLSQLSPILPNVRVELSGSTSPFDSLGFQFGGLPSGGFAINVPGTPLEDQFANVSKEQPPFVFYNASAYLRAGWQIDLGASYLNSIAAGRDADAADDDSAQSEAQNARTVIDIYLNAIMAQKQISIINAQIESGESLLALAKARLELAQGSSVDVLQQEQQVASLRASLQPVNAQLDNAKRQLALLSATYETLELNEELNFPGFIDAPLGSPEELAQNLPEVRAAKARLDASRIRSTSAWLSFLPTLGINAQAGGQSFITTSARNQLNWSLGGVITIPIFQSARNIQNVRLSSANEKALHAQYDAAKRRAVFVVESAANRVQALNAQAQQSQKQQRLAEGAFTESIPRFQKGAISFTQVLLAQNSAFISQLQNLNIERQRLGAHLDLLAATRGNPSEN